MQAFSDYDYEEKLEPKDWSEAAADFAQWAAYHAEVRRKVSNIMAPRAPAGKKLQMSWPAVPGGT